MMDLYIYIVLFQAVAHIASRIARESLKVSPGISDPAGQALQLWVYYIPFAVLTKWLSGHFLQLNAFLII